MILFRRLFLSVRLPQAQDGHGPAEVQVHGPLAPCPVPVPEEGQQQSMVLEGALREGLFILGEPQGLRHRLIDDGAQVGEEVVVGGGGDGLVEALVGIRPVVPRQDVLPDLLRQGQDALQLLPAGPAAGQGRQLRLQQQLLKQLLHQHQLQLPDSVQPDRLPAVSAHTFLRKVSEHFPSFFPELL